MVIIKAGIEMLASPINQLLGAQASPDLIRDIKAQVIGTIIAGMSAV